MRQLLLVYAIANSLFIALHIAGCVGILRLLFLERRRARSLPAAGPSAPTVEVVVVVRNEGQHLPRLLASLARQTNHRCTFLFVDDRSTDATPRLLEKFRASLPGRVRLLRTEAEALGLTGKQAALDLAFDAARGEVLLLTDGDCEVPPRWAEDVGSRFSDPSVGVVLGRVQPVGGQGFCGRFQAFEQPLINQYNFAIAGIGGASGCFGNNLAVRRAAVQATGGFRTIGWSVTEDAALLTAIHSQRRWKVQVSLGTDTVVRTAPAPQWTSFINQHTRWNAGAIRSRNLLTRLAYLFVIVISLPLTLLMLPLGFLDLRLALLSLVSVVCVGSFGLLGGLYPGIDRGGYYLRLLPFLLFFVFFYSFVTWRAVLSRPFEWKGRRMKK